MRKGGYLRMIFECTGIMFVRAIYNTASTATPPAHENKRDQATTLTTEPEG